jgi:hypothetical protein
MMTAVPTTVFVRVAAAMACGECRATIKVRERDNQDESARLAT